MNITKTVFVMAVLLMATPVGSTNMTLSSAKAAEPLTLLQANAALRVATVFELVAAMPEAAPFTLPMAQKGDLLVRPRWAGLNSGAQVGCTEAADEMYLASNTVVENREAATSSAPLKLDRVTIAAVNDKPLDESE